MFDPYKILGLNRGASDEEIHRAYRRRAKETHPDAGGSTDEFNEVNRARLILGDPDRRERFDETDEGDTRTAFAVEQTAWDLINQMLREAAQQNDGVFHEDIIARMTDAVREEIDDIEVKVAEIRATAGRAKRLSLRFRRRGEGVNRIAIMLENQSREIEGLARFQEDKLQIQRKMLEILGDYEFDVLSSSTFQDCVWNQQRIGDDGVAKGEMEEGLYLGSFKVRY